MTLDLSPITTPMGSVLLNGDGHISGFIVGASGGHLVVAPGAGLETTIKALLAGQVLSPHVIGLTCDTVSAASTRPAGAQIVSVTPSSAAAAVGLSVGEIIIGVNGLTITSQSSFTSAVHLASPTTPLVLTVYSGSSSRSVIIPASIAPTP